MAKTPVIACYSEQAWTSVDGWGWSLRRMKPSGLVGACGLDRLGGRLQTLHDGAVNVDQGLQRGALLHHLA
jgi:hypothetical protein